MAPEFDYYETLEVPRDADAKAVKRAFLKKARVLHPDVSTEPDAEEKFKRLNEAYSVLSDPDKRANYDRYGDPAGPSGFGGGGMDDIFGGGFSMDDLFSTFFGGGGMGSNRRAARTRGRDMLMTMRISLEEAATGFTRTVSYDRLAPCDDCGGTGSEGGAEPETCPHCHGTGHVTTVQRTILGAMQTQTVCPECDGTGQVISDPCPTCDGQGRTPSHDTVTIEVPAGVYSGQEIRVEGMGEAGIRGERTGDLVIRIEVLENEDFVRGGNDLGTIVEVDLLHAIVGQTVEIDGILPDEKVEVEVPAGVVQGDQVVVEGFGMPIQGSDRRGDLVAHVQLVQPADLAEFELDSIRELVDAHDKAKRAEHMVDSFDFGKEEKKPRPKKKSRFGKKKKK